MGKRMGEVTVEQRFHGTVALTILHLRRLAKSNDIDAGFAAAHDLKMIGPEHEAFMRPPEPVTVDTVDQLQACVLRINSADPA